MELLSFDDGSTKDLYISLGSFSLISRLRLHFYWFPSMHDLQSIYV